MTLFMWGYWGWGNATKELVRLIDASENQHGFGPPMFVDVRVRRSVRAEGFRDNNFERRVGKARYRWVPDLGNQSIIDHGKAIKIRRPEAASELLDLAIQLSRKRKRIIYFCSCGWPCYCHRTIVAKLLLAEARRCGRALEVVEWPGGEPSRKPITVNVSDKALRSFRKTFSSLALEGNQDMTLLGSLAIGTLVTAKAITGEPITFAAAPAIVTGGKWTLPSLWTDDDKPIPLDARTVKAWRRTSGYTSLRYIPRN